MIRRVSTLLLGGWVSACSSAEGPSGVPGAYGGTSGISGQGGTSGHAGATAGSGAASMTAGNTSGGTPAGGTTSGGMAGAAGAMAAAGAAVGGATFRPATGMCELSLVCAGEIPEDAKRTCELEIRDATGLVVYAAQAGVELRGRTSLRYPKQNYSVELRLASGLENPQNLFGMGQESDWIFDGSWVDRSFMRNNLAFEMFRDTGRYAAESRYCNLTLDADPQGVYRLVERIKRDDDRLNLMLDDGTGQSFLIKQDETGTLRFDVGIEDQWQIIYPRQDDATAAQVNGIQAWLDNLDAALDAPGAPDVFSMLDLAATVDFILIQEFSKNIDAYNLSLHLARDAGGLAIFIPWDFDLAFGQPTLSNAMNEAASGWVHGRTAFIRALTSNTDLQARVGPRWRELRAGPYSDVAVLEKLDRYAAALPARSLEANFAVWPIEDVDFTQIYRPYSLYPVGSHAEELSRLRAWIQERLTWMDGRIDTYPD